MKEYKTCEEVGTEVYNSCLTGSNTCTPGYVNTTCSEYKRCSSCSCSTYSKCRDSSCGCDSYSCSSGGSVSGSKCTGSTYTFRNTSCWCKFSKGSYTSSGCSGSTDCDEGYTKSVSYSCSNCSQSVASQSTTTKICKNISNLSNFGAYTGTKNLTATATCKWKGNYNATCSRYSSCRNSSCSCETYNRCSSCGCESYNQTYSSCATGTNTCVGGYQTEESCSKVSTEKYYSGEGGINFISNNSRVQTNNQTKTTGVREGDGLIVISYKGETL